MSPSSSSSPPSESLSPAVPSSRLVEAKASLDMALAGYQPLDAEDDTKAFLEATFNYLPIDGQCNFGEDVSACRNDDELRQLVESIDTGLLRPMLSQAMKAPQIIPSRHRGRDDTIENMHSLDIESVRNEHVQLRKNCLKRGGYQCVIAKF